MGNMMNAMMGGMNSSNNSSATTPAAASGGGMDFSNLLPGNGGGTGSGAGAGVASPDFSRMMQQMQGMMGGNAGSTRDSNVNGNPFAPQQQQQLSQPSQQQHPADRYRNQLQSLRDMGFDKEQQGEDEDEASTPPEPKDAKDKKDD